MHRRWLRITLVGSLTAVLALVGIVGCSATPDGAPPLADEAPPPVHTFVEERFDEEWTPAHEPGPEVLSGLVALYEEVDVRILLPAPAPIGDPLDARAQLTARTAGPSAGRTTVVLLVEGATWTVSLIGSESSGLPSCEDELATTVPLSDDSLAWSPLTVRDSAGCIGQVNSPDPDVVSVVRWEESGTRFEAEFRQREMPREQLVAWMEGWSVVR